MARPDRLPLTAPPPAAQRSFVASPTLVVAAIAVGWRAPRSTGPVTACSRSPASGRGWCWGSGRKARGRAAPAARPQAPLRVHGQPRFDGRHLGDLRRRPGLVPVHRQEAARRDPAVRLGDARRPLHLHRPQNAARRAAEHRRGHPPDQVGTVGGDLPRGDADPRRPAAARSRRAASTWRWTRAPTSCRSQSGGPAR